MEVAQANQWILSPHKWICGTSLDPEDMSGDFEGLGFFHVTTRLSSVLHSQRLKSRLELKDQNIVALGGGDHNEAPDRVSFTTDVYRARWLRDAIKVAAQAARNLVSASEVASAVFGWTEFPSEYLYDLNEEEKRTLVSLRDFAALVGFNVLPEDEDDLWSWGGWLSLVKKYSKEINKVHGTGKAKYELIQDMEARIMEYRAPAREEDLSTVGFTATWESFRRIFPSEIAIVQCAVHADAQVDIVPEERELRIHPQHTKLTSDSFSGHKTSQGVLDRCTERGSG